MRPSPGSDRTPVEIDKSGQRRFVCLEFCASPVLEAALLLPRITRGLRNLRPSLEPGVSQFLWQEARPRAFAEVCGITTARAIPGNRWYRIHDHRPPLRGNPVPPLVPC